MNRSRLESEPRLYTRADSFSNSAQVLKPANPRASKNVLKSIVSNVALKSDSFLQEKRQLVSALDHRRPSAQARLTSKMNHSVQDERLSSTEGSPERHNNHSVSFFNLQKVAMKNQISTGCSDSKMNIQATLSTSVASTSPIRYTEQSTAAESLSRMLEEKFKVAEVNKQITKDSVDCREQRKLIESQVSALEARIAKLKHEEDEVMKRVQKVKDDTDKVMKSKKRRQDDLLLKEQFYKQRDEEMRKRREKVLNHRANGKTFVQQAKTNNYESKAAAVSYIKQDSNNYKSIKQNLDKEKSEKNKTLVRKVGEQHDAVKVKKIEKEITGMIRFTEKHVTQMSRDKDITNRLTKKYEKLAEYEQEMLEKLGRTYELHKTHVYELNQIASVKMNITVNDKMDSLPDEYEEEIADVI